MSDINIKTIFGLSLLIFLIISFLLIPLFEVDLLRQIVFKWLLIYFFSLLAILIINNKIFHSKVIDSILLFFSPITWLTYGSAAIWYIRLFSLDWFWFVVYPGFVISLFVSALLLSKDALNQININPQIKVLCVLPVALGLVRVYLWGESDITLTQTLLLVLMNITGAIQFVVAGGFAALAVKTNLILEKPDSES